MKFLNNKIYFVLHFETIESDLVVLTGHNDFEHAVNDPDEDLQGHLFALSNELSSFIKNKQMYDQVRFIDLQGNEVIRINAIERQAYLVPTDKLQNKADRYYFKETLALDAGQIFISPLDLNMENGQIELPFKPTIRFGLPIYDYNHKPHGILIINYLAQQLLDSLDFTKTEKGNHLLLVNTEGYWLKGLTPEEEWGFMHEQHKDQVMAKTFPHAWSEISKNESGQFIDEHGMFTYNTIRPLLKRSSLGNDFNRNQVANQDYAWKIISFHPYDKLFAHKEKILERFIWGDSLVILLILFSCWMYLKLKFKEITVLRLIEEKDYMVRNIVKTAFDGIITIDKRGQITSFNPAALRMFGYSLDEVMGKNIKMIVSEPHKSNHDEYLKRYTETLEPHIIGTPRELDAIHKDGTVFPIELCVSAKQIENNWMFIGVVRNIRERKEMQKALELMATVDGLTQVYNRAFFTKQIDYEFSRARRYDLNLSMVLLDIDFFKTVNDEHGHPAGDAMLVCIAEVAKKVSRDTDIVTRYGGEEFAIILPETDEKQAVLYAERLRKTIEESEITYEEKVIKRTASIGVACVSASHPDTTDHFIKMADDALYKAKDSGRNQVVLWDESLIG